VQAVNESNTTQESPLHRGLDPQPHTLNTKPAIRNTQPATLNSKSSTAYHGP
jgi:hypothetical protein